MTDLTLLSQDCLLLSALFRIEALPLAVLTLGISKSVEMFGTLNRSECVAHPLCEEMAVTRNQSGSVVAFDSTKGHEHGFSSATVIKKERPQLLHSATANAKADVYTHSATTGYSFVPDSLYIKLVYTCGGHNCFCASSAMCTLRDKAESFFILLGTKNCHIEIVHCTERKYPGGTHVTGHFLCPTLERHWIHALAASDLGRPLNPGTNDALLDYFGIPRDL